MPLGSRCVQPSRLVINSRYSDKDFLSLEGWSKQKIKHRFKLAMACTNYRDHRTYAQVLFSHGDKGHKKVFKKIDHSNNIVIDLSAPKQVVSTCPSTGVNNTMEINTREGYVKGRHVVHTNKLSSNPSLDPIVDNQLGTYQVSSQYSLPVTNKFQLLDVEEEIQMNTDKAMHEPAVVLTVSESTNLHSDLKDTNTKNTALAGDTIHTFSSDAEQGYSDPDLTRSGSIDTDPEVVPEYRKCKAQIGTKFGCVPLAPIYVYKGENKVWHSVPDVLMAHTLIRNTGNPSFLGLRIPVRTNLNVSSWRKHLSDYFDQQLPDLIEFGFPLDFDRTRHLQSTLVNHASARLYPDHVSKYIQEEVGFKAMLGPWIINRLMSIFHHL